jgi:CLIP-associating protein 1/2
MSISGKDLLLLVTAASGAAADDSAGAAARATLLDAINEFKAFVKKEFVDVSQVALYMRALCTAVDLPHSPEIQTASFSVVAHLVKRVSMQDHQGKVLQLQSFLVLPIILRRLGDARAATRSTAKRALEAYWFLAPHDVELALNEIALASHNPVIMQELIQWLLHIVTNVSQMFKLDSFVPRLAQILQGTHDDLLRASTRRLLVEYYALGHNEAKKPELVRALTAQRVPQRVCEGILAEIDSRDKLYEGHRREAHGGHVRTNPGASVAASVAASAAATAAPGAASTVVSTAIQTPRSVDPELAALTAKLPHYKFDDTLKAINVDSGDSLEAAIANMTSPFDGKETEFNWGLRERNVIQLRLLVRGNSVVAFRPQLVAILRDVADLVCKAILSLRTTLSMHGCQLVKECAMLLGADFDGVVDAYLPLLTKLCLATKNIALTNANSAICAIYAHCLYHPKLLARVQHLLMEKNHQPRLYSAVWLQILLVRFAATHEHQFTPESACAKVIAKLLGDQNPAVRQLAKDAFWTFWAKFPAQGDAMLAKLEGNIVRALERSRPQAAAAAAAASGAATATPEIALRPRPSKPSIRDSIVARNREIRDKQRESRASSRPSSNVGTRTDDARALPMLKFNRLGGSRRNVSHEPTHTAPTQLSTGKHRTLSAGAGAPDAAFDVHTDPILKFLLAPLLELKLEGVSLLKYAIMGDEPLSGEIKQLLARISVGHVELLKPLVTGSAELTRKTANYLGTEDFIRTCAILRDQVDVAFVELLASFIPCDEIYAAFATILGHATKISSILNNGDLVMQMIKHKTAIFAMLLAFLSISLDHVPIADATYHRLIGCLFEMVTILRSTRLYDSLIGLLKKMDRINAPLFDDSLQHTSILIRDEVALQRAPPPLPQSTELTSYDLTKVVLNAPPGSPLKEPSDLTMLVPTFGAQDEVVLAHLNKEPHFDAVADNIDEMETEDANVFVEDSGSRRSDLFAKFNKENLTELVEGFAQVQIAEPDPMQSLMDKIDPLNLLSNKKKQITIYHDADGGGSAPGASLSGSPQKQRDYNYGEINWFNYRISKRTNTSSPESFEVLCRKLGRNALEHHQFMDLLRILQARTPTQPEALEESLWSFLDANCEAPNCANSLSGLIILKQLLVNREYLDLGRLWPTLIKMQGMADEPEIAVALAECFDEMLVGSFSLHELLSMILSTLPLLPSARAAELVFVLELFHKLLSTNSIGLLVTDAVIAQTHAALACYLDHELVAVRRFTVLIYGRLLSTSKVESNAMDTILGTLPVPQKKLIEYYSH